MDAHSRGVPILDIAKAHRRGTGVIQARLIKFGLIPREQYRNFPDGEAAEETKPGSTSRNGEAQEL